MKNTTYFSRQHIFRWLLLCWLLVPWGLQAQSSTHITWDSQVGCQIFRGEKGSGNDPFAASDIDSGACVRVCEGSKVKYTAHGSNISFVAWIPTGGVVQTTSGVPILMLKFYGKRRSWFFAGSCYICRWNS
jgi:hypothetical protein